MMPPAFKRYCRQWSLDAARFSDESRRMAYFQKHLPELLKDHATVRAVLSCMTRGDKWPDLRQSGLFRHEVLLYLDPGRRFSIRLYFHPPHTPTHIHDHTAWGVSGTPFGRLSVVHYGIEGDVRKGHVRLFQKDRITVRPGQIEVTRPWEAGIHQTGSGDSAVNLMVSVYGRPGRRLYIQRFDAQSGRVERIHPPRLMKRRLAKAALGGL